MRPTNLDKYAPPISSMATRVSIPDRRAFYQQAQAERNAREIEAFYLKEQRDSVKAAEATLRSSDSEKFL